MKKDIPPKFVTDATFKTELVAMRSKIAALHADVTTMHSDVSEDKVTHQNRFERLETMIGRLSLSTLKNEADIREMKETLMTREMGQTILNHLEGLTRAYREAENSTRIHLNQLMDFRPRIDDHEKRLILLETQNPPRS